MLTYGSERALFVWFYLSDFAALYMQFQLLDLIWRRKKLVQEYEVSLVMMIVFFNPLQLISPCCANVGGIRDVFMYLSIYLFLEPLGKDTLDMLNHAGVTGLSLYLDPTSWVLHAGFFLCAMDKQTFLQSFIAVVFCRCIMLTTGNFEEQIRNIKNILYIRDHSENIGVYWYARIEVFVNHTDFFIYAYLLFLLVALLQIRIMYRRCMTTIRIAT